MVDRVVLPALDEAKQVRELQRHGALVLDQGAQPSRETLDVRHVGEDVVPGHQVRAPVPLGDLAAGVGAEELYLGTDAAGAGRLGHVRGRLDAEHRDARGLEVLQQITIVAGDLGDQAVAGQAEPTDHRLRVSLRMRHPGVGVRGEVSVVREDILARYIGGKLYEQTGIAQPDVKWIEDLRVIKPCLGDVALT